MSGGRGGKGRVGEGREGRGRAGKRREVKGQAGVEERRDRQDGETQDACKRVYSNLVSYVCIYGEVCGGPATADHLCYARPTLRHTTPRHNSVGGPLLYPAAVTGRRCLGRRH